MLQKGGGSRRDKLWRVQGTATIEILLMRSSDHDYHDIQEFYFGRRSQSNKQSEVNKTKNSTQPEGNLLDDAIQEIKSLAEERDQPANTTVLSTTVLNVPSWQKTFQCMEAHDGTEGQNNPNSRTIEVLNEMKAYYERMEEEWKVLSYRRAISILKKTKQFIGTQSEAQRCLLRKTTNNVVSLALEKDWPGR